MHGHVQLAGNGIQPVHLPKVFGGDAAVQLHVHPPRPQKAHRGKGFFKPARAAAQGLVGGVIECGVAAGHDKDRDAGLRAQLVRVARGVGAHDDDLRRDVDDLLHVRLAVRAGDGQILELVEVYVVIQAAHAGLGLIILHADGTVGRADIAAVAQRTDADAHDALHLLGDFHGAVFAVGERAHVAGGAVVRLCAAGRAGQHHQHCQQQADPSSISHSECILSSCISPFRSIVISITDGGQNRNPPQGMKMCADFSRDFC